MNKKKDEQKFTDKIVLLLLALWSLYIVIFILTAIFQDSLGEKTSSIIFTASAIAGSISFGLAFIIQSISKVFFCNSGLVDKFIYSLFLGCIIWSISLGIYLATMSSNRTILHDSIIVVGIVSIIIAFISMFYKRTRIFGVSIILWWFLGSIVVLLINKYVFNDGLSEIKSQHENVLNFSRDLNQNSDITLDKVIEIVNHERVEHNLNELLMNTQLNEAANLKSEYMCQKQFWSHVAPDGTDPWHFFNQSNYRYLMAGENLARDFNTTQELVDSWMNSELHKNNILSQQYTDTGVSVKKCKLEGIDTYLVVQLFGQPMQFDRYDYGSISEGVVSNSNINPETPVHCPINDACGGGSTPLTYSECKNSTCCKLNDGWYFYKEASQCLEEQKKLGLISSQGYGVTLDSNIDPNEPIHCSIHPNCGGGTTPLTYAECENSICCNTSNGWVFMKDRLECN